MKGYKCRGDFMLNEERVKLMIKLASYESVQGNEDFKISSYYRNDYTSLRTIITLIWSTIGYAIAVGIIGIVFMDKLLSNMTLSRCITIGVVVVVAYILLLLICGLVVSRIYHRNYNEAKQRVKKYYRDLVRLNRMYEKEKL